jgi:hypothetical protein
MVDLEIQMTLVNPILSVPCGFNRGLEGLRPLLKRVLLSEPDQVVRRIKSLTHPRRHLIAFLRNAAEGAIRCFGAPLTTLTAMRRKNENAWKESS